MLNIYEYPTCSTCRKAKKLLTENNIEATYYNVKEKTPTVDEFKKIIETFDLPLKKLFNTDYQYFTNTTLHIKVSKNHLHF